MRAIETLARSGRSGRVQGKFRPERLTGRMCRERDGSQASDRKRRDTPQCPYVRLGHRGHRGDRRYDGCPVFVDAMTPTAAFLLGLLIGTSTWTRCSSGNVTFSAEELLHDSTRLRRPHHPPAHRVTGLERLKAGWQTRPPATPLLLAGASSVFGNLPGCGPPSMGR